MKKFRMNRKGISPIFATLILIAIAVIAGVVVYAFTSGWLSGMTQSTTAAQERVTVSGAQGTTTSVTVYIQNMDANTPVHITGLLVKDSAGTIASDNSPITTSPGVVLTAVTQANGLVDVTGAVALTAGTYTVTVTTANGGQFVSPNFTVG